MLSGEQLKVLPRYDWARSYRWNYENVPAPQELAIPAFPGSWDFCGLPIDSPLGIPAGPLLNGGWCVYYASLGFDVLTYKTVRSRRHACYEMPNLQPVNCGSLMQAGDRVQAVREMQGSWAVSFGMPSSEPDCWRRDIEKTRAALPAGKVLAVSVVGTHQSGWTIDELADDYANCAAWAVESGADTVETNFSCPNVSTCDGQLFQEPQGARIVAERVRSRIGRTPYVIKIGFLPDDDEARKLVDAVGEFADGVAMTNSIAATVFDREVSLFEGQPRGICGDSILAASLAQVSRFDRVVRDSGHALQLVGVGGVSTLSDLLKYCKSGAHAVQLATAAMVHPGVAIAIRQEISQGASDLLGHLLRETT